MVLAITKILTNSTSGGDEVDPSSTPPTTIPTKTINFTISLKAGIGGLPTAFFSNQTPPRAPSDGPADIRIKDDCKVVLMLDTSSPYDFEFRPNRALTLARNDDRPGNRYAVLTPILDGNGRWIGLSFYAAHETKNVMSNLDPYNLYFNVYFRNATDGSRISPPLTLRFDPDIKNPGDDGIQ